jgi:hypothetical protein
VANQSQGGISLLLRKMQGEFEKMQRGANRNRAKTGPFSMTCMGLSLLTEQGHNHCLAGTFRKTSAESRITDKILPAVTSPMRRLGQSFDMVGLSSRANVNW